jgi:hypothetical protein
LLNTLPRWYSTVLGLMNSCAPIQPVEARRAELLQRREGEFHLPFVSLGAKNPEALRRRNRLLHQGRLADARLS